MMMLSFVRIDVAPGKHKEALNILHSVADRTRPKNGCVSCSIYQDTEKKYSIILEELWMNEGEMTRHLRSQEYQNVLIVMDMAQKQPEIRFDKIASSTGFETIEIARMGQRA